MFDWLQRIFRRSRDEKRPHLCETIDALNAEVGGGQPTTATQVLGYLTLRSGTLILGDPQYLPGLEVPNIVGTQATLSAALWQYPSGAVTVTALTIRLGDETSDAPSRKIGELGIDSAKVVVADKADFEDHWTDLGKDRIGVISTAPDDTVLRLLTKRFKLRTVRVNAVRAEVIGPVSEQLAGEIEEYLKKDARYASFPYMHFHVQTNNSFDRANYLRKAWSFIPVGNADTPLMLVCGTGRGDGSYAVQCAFSGEVPCVLSICFIEDADE